MPLYFFDVIDGFAVHDNSGTEYATEHEAIDAARGLLPDVAKEEIWKNGDRRFFTVVVRDESRHPIYIASLSYSGLRLTEPPCP